MSRLKNQQWVPRLRFPEFRDAEEWEAKEVQDCLEYERPDAFIVNSDNYHQNGTPVLTANQSFILGYTKENDGICTHVPAVIFDDFTTDMKYVDFPFKVKSSAIKILRTKEGHNLSFLYELIHRMPFDASQHKRHYISEYQHQVIKLPRLKEQSKIADCLSSLDALIAGLSRKIDTLKEHKKGLMQQLFPQLGETVPQLRFPEFRDAGAWVQRDLGDILVLNYGKSLRTEDRLQGKVPVYGSNGIVGTHNEAMVEMPGIIVGRKGSAGRVHFSPVPFYPIDTTFYLTCNDVPEIDLRFLYFLLKRTGLEGINEIGSIPGLNRENTYMERVRVPFSRREQERVASCLSSLDELISAQGRRLKALTTHKKGLMQQLFPTVAESTP